MIIDCMVCQFNRSGNSETYNNEVVNYNQEEK